MGFELPVSFLLKQAKLPLLFNIPAQKEVGGTLLWALPPIPAGGPFPGGIHLLAEGGNFKRWGRATVGPSKEAARLGQAGRHRAASHGRRPHFSLS